MYGICVNITGLFATALVPLFLYFLISVYRRADDDDLLNYCSLSHISLSLFSRLYTALSLSI